MTALTEALTSIFSLFWKAPERLKITRKPTASTPQVPELKVTDKTSAVSVDVAPVMILVATIAAPEPASKFNKE